MVSVSKIMLLLSLLFTTLFSLQLEGSKGGVVSSEVEEGFYTPSKVSIAMSNYIMLRNLTIDCIVRNHDLGARILDYGETFEFSFSSNFFCEVPLYFCRFIWRGASHYFDIYNQNRDKCVECMWNIFETGPCKVYPKYSKCYAWKS